MGRFLILLITSLQSLIKISVSDKKINNKRSFVVILLLLFF